MPVLSKEQADQLGEDVRRSIEMAEEQLAQHKCWLFNQLRGAIPTDYGLTDWQWQQLLDQVTEIKTEMVQVGVREDGEESSVTLVNSYPDELHQFLSREDIPREWSFAGQGGITLQPPQEIRVATEEDEK